MQKRKLDPFPDKKEKYSREVTSPEKKRAITKSSDECFDRNDENARHPQVTPSPEKKRVTAMTKSPDEFFDKLDENCYHSNTSNTGAAF